MPGRRRPRLQNKAQWERVRSYHLKRLWLVAALAQQGWGIRSEVARAANLNPGYLSSLLSGYHINKLRLEQIEEWVLSHLTDMGLPPLPLSSAEQEALGWNEQREQGHLAYEARRQYLQSLFQQRLLPFGSARLMAHSINKDANQISAILNWRYEDARILEAMEAWAEQQLEASNERTNNHAGKSL